MVQKSINGTYMKHRNRRIRRSRNTVLSAEITVLYYAEKLEYVSGGELTEPGKISVKKTLQARQEIMEMLQFLPKISGTTDISDDSDRCCACYPDRTGYGRKLGKCTCELYRFWKAVSFRNYH